MLNKINISPQKQKLIVYIVLTVVTLAVYWQVNQFDFINVDDDVYVTKNSHVQSGITLDGLRWAFTETHFIYWHPLTLLSFMFEYQLYGLNASGYHVTNVILHILNTLLLFWLFNRMTGESWKSAFIAACFALHPLRVESVAWVAERKDVLSVFFWMLTLCLYVYYTEKPIIRRYLFILFCFICGLMSKPMVVTLPVVMILLDYWPLGRFDSLKGNVILWQLKEKTPFFILSAVFSIITLYACSKPSLEIIPLSYRITNALFPFVIYLEKIFLPCNLSFFYLLPEQIHILQALAAFLLILAISAAVIMTVKRLPYLFVGWLWYAVTIFPILGIMNTDIPWMHNAYSYIPSIGITVMLTWGISFLIKREEIRKIILFPAGIATLTILAVLTWQQCSYWKNSITLFSHDLQVMKDNYLAHNNMGRAYGGNLAQYGRAIMEYNEAIRLKPNYADAYNNRGNAYGKLDQYQRAIADYNEAIRLKPYYAVAYHNRAVAYFLQGNKDRGCSDVQKACALGECRLLELAKSNGYCR